MRFLIIFIIIIIVAVSAYYDLQQGTIPHSNIEDAPVNNESTEPHNDNDNDNDNEVPLDISYEEVKVEAGQTVYGIVHKINEGYFTQAPHQVIEDFEALNPQVSAHEIIIGHSYRFPIYSTND